MTTVLIATLYSTSVFAHSHLSSSNPADGDILIEPLSEIVLQFDGGIEQGGHIEVTNSEGQAIDLTEIIIEDNTLTATVATDLPNDEYEVHWSVISADGHPLDGVFSFTVDMPVAESIEEVKKESSATTEVDEQLNETEEISESEEITTTTAVEDESSSTLMILIIFIVVLIIAGLFFIWKRKK